MIDTTIDKRSISALIRALKRITANGGDLDDGSLWNDSPSRDQFENLKELKAHKESLQRLGKSIEKARFILQLSCNAQHLQSGINDLPVEILSRIFVLSRPPSLAGFDQAMSLSHVCRHFRSVALGELSLWATASLGRPIGQVQICLTRSGSVPLTVVMGESPHYSDVDDDQVVEFLELVTPHAHRWSALHVGKSVQAESTNSVVRTKYPNLHLPLLTKLVQKQPAFIDDPLVSFLATWTTPMLTSYSYFVVENMSPPIAILRSPITRCSIFWTRSLNPFDVDIAAIVRVLATMSALEELEVMFLGGAYRPVSVPNQEPVNLPSIRSLSLSLGSADQPEMFLDDLFTLADFPNVASLKYSLTSLGTLEGITRVILTPDDRPRFKKLEKLDIHDDSFEFAGGIVESIISNYPSLLHLSLDLPIMSLYEGYEGFGSRTKPVVWSSILSLQTLRLKRCDKVTAAEMSFLVGNIRGSPSWDTFLRLDVIDCKYLTECFCWLWEDCLEGKMSWSKDILC